MRERLATPSPTAQSRLPRRRRHRRRRRPPTATTRPSFWATARRHTITSTILERSLPTPAETGSTDRSDRPLRPASAGLPPAYADTAMSFPGSAAPAPFPFRRPLSSARFGGIARGMAGIRDDARDLHFRRWVRKRFVVRALWVVLQGKRADSRAILHDRRRAGSRLDDPNFHRTRPYYVAGTYDGTTGRLYINGVQNATATISGTFKNYAPAIRLLNWRRCRA